MVNWQGLIAIAGTSVLIVACGGGSGSTGLGAPTGVTLTITSGQGAAQSQTSSQSVGPSAVAPRWLRTNAGFSGFSHGLQIFEGASYTADLRECDGETDTQCVLHAATGGTAFGPPTPLSVGGVSVCLLIDYESDLTGEMDLVTGALSQKAQVAIRIYSSNEIDRPCPACVPANGDPQLGETGICAGGPDDGQPCTVEALADPSLLAFRGTSLLCRPPGHPIGEFATLASATTGDFVLATSEASPNCRASGWGDRKCLCDVCDDPAATPCHSNADCPSPSGTPGVCGVGNRGAATQQNTCVDRVCTPTGPDTGVCQSGPSDSHCVVQPFRSCLDDADCPAPGDTCNSSPRSCLLDRIALTGSADPLVGGVANPTLVGGFCLGTFGSAAVNTAGGFPGPVSYVWPARIVVEP
jgi:hypothetical protein